MMNGYALMAVEEHQGIVVGLEMLTAEPNVRAMRERLPEVLAQHLFRARLLPAGIVVRSDLLANLIAPFARALDCELHQSDALPNLDPAKESLMAHMIGE